MNKENLMFHQVEPISSITNITELSNLSVVELDSNTLSQLWAGRRCEPACKEGCLIICF